MNVVEKDLRFLKEFRFEEEIVEKLNALGWKQITSIKRNNTQEVIDFSLLQEQIKEINHVDDEIAVVAINKIKRINDTYISMNKECWDFLVEGIKVYDQKTELYKTIKLISQNNSQNVYQVIRQLEVSDGRTLRVPDVVLYINGLPVVVFELKAPLATENLEDAFNQNQSLKQQLPKLWAFNVMNFLSNRIVSLYGSSLAGFKRMHTINNFKTKDGIDILEYLFDKDNFYKFITTFSFYSLENNAFVKYMAAPHQIEAVIKTIAKLKIAGDNRGGVVWHTQGSGKSVTMVMLAKAIIEEINNATIVVVTDRNTLDQQLHKRFLNAEDYLRNKAVTIESRKDLKQKLKDKKHFGIYFSTVQKFTEEASVLTDRGDLFILVDEAHRTQNNIDGEKILSKENEEFINKFGFARYMRDAFPNAKIIGFTGTPLMKFDKETTQVFGDYNHIYSMNDAVADNAVVPIHYEMRKVNLDLNQDELDEMDFIQNEYLKTLNLNDITSQQKIDTLLKSVRLKQILEDDDVIRAKATDILRHLAKRSAVLHGKAMIVASTRLAAFKYYKTIISLDPSLKDKVILVITESNKDTLDEMWKAIVPKRDVNKVAEEFRKDNSKYQIAIVVDMWLTGYDVPDLDVLYLDKIIKWHNLMQAIARVNRTYEDKITKQIKENGLIVDYIGIWKLLADALLHYASGKEQTVDISIEDVNKAKEKLLEAFAIINDSYVKDLDKFILLNPKEQYRFIISAVDKILAEVVDKKNEFILLARKTKRFFKMAYSVINQTEATTAKCIEVINSFISSTSIQTDEELQNTIALIKAAIARAVDSKTSEVFVSATKISKNINEVAKILALEAKELEKSSPYVAIEFMKHSIKANLKILQNIRPVFAKKASDKLREIINALQRQEDIQQVMELLKALSKDIVNEKNKPLEFKDRQLQAFFEVLSNDDYLKNNQNSEVLRRLAEELVDEIKKSGTEQYENNPQVRSKIKTKLKILLKTKYNYPPDHLGGVSGILVDQLTREIKIDKEFFRRDD
ncbi:MAG: HsdR family type I site-specific deoxyribonuclease [Spiroplasma sp.]|nr:HsdR family type I site-specific deoxyribonuclease [Spiroplasma sp.]